MHKLYSYKCPLNEPLLCALFGIQALGASKCSSHSSKCGNAMNIIIIYLVHAQRSVIAHLTVPESEAFPFQNGMVLDIFDHTQ